jgi:CelD/BcsL family acetyltransferase involved in cellulose biosynthesis
MVSVERVTTEEGLFGLQSEWNRLLEQSKSNCVFLTFEWLSTWWKHLAEGRKLELLAARLDGELVGILPLVLRRAQYTRMMPRILEFIGTGVIGSDYLDAIIRNDKQDDVLDALAHHLDVRGLMVQFNQLNHADSLAAQLARRLNNRHWILQEVEINECPYIPLEGHTWQTYLAELSSSQRYNFQRRLRNLEKTKGFRFERNTALDVIIDLHKKRWADRQGQSEAFQTDSIIAFHREFTHLAEKRGWLRLLSIWMGEQPMAGLYGLRYGSKFYFYQSGFDAAFSKQSAGLVMMGLSIQTALEEGATEYDLLHGCEEYKFHWARQRRELGRIEAFPPQMRGALYKHCLTANRAARRLVRRMLVRAS